MIRLGWARTNISRMVSRLKHVWKWATAEKLVPPGVCQTVSGLRAGRSEAKESAPVEAAAEEFVRAILPHLSTVAAAMVELRMISGMRPGEGCAMRTCDIDRTGALWLYPPAEHKTQHHGHTRAVILGPKAQAILTPFLPTDPLLHAFRPAAAVGGAAGPRPRHAHDPAQLREPPRLEPKAEAGPRRRRCLRTAGPSSGRAGGRSRCRRS